MKPGGGVVYHYCPNLVALAAALTAANKVSWLKYSYDFVFNSEGNMTNEHDLPSTEAGLSRLAEEVDKRNAPSSSEDIEALSPAEIQRKFSELRVYQIELEMQNEQLRQTQADLEALQGRYFDLYDMAPVAYCTVSEKGLILEANLKTTELLGQNSSVLIGQELTRFIFIEDQDRYYLLRRKLFGSSKPQAYDLRMVQMNGTVFWVHLSVSLAQDAVGAPVCRMVLIDQTEYKQTVEKYRSLVENTSDCIWEIDKHGRYTYLSPAFQSLTGYSPEEFLGKTPADLLPDDKYTQFREQMMATRTAPRPFSAVETQIQRRDGRLVTMEAGGIPLFSPDGQFLGMRGISRDVTERKVMEDKLRTSQEQYQMLFENAADTIVIIDMEANILSVNDQACSQYGYKKEEFLQLRVHDLDTPEEAVHIPERLALLAREGKAVFEAVHRDAKGNTFPVEAKAIKISFNGKPCFMSICRDITQRKESEKFLRVMNEELERRVERRTLALQESQKQYLHAEKLSAIGRLSATVAHEFGNPLLGIQYFLKDLKNKKLLHGEDRQYLETALEESQRMRDLIGTLRDFSRTSPGVKAHVDVHKTLDSLLLLLKIDFNNKEILLVRDYANDLSSICAVPDQIKQVFLNILTNAADACDQVGAMITVSTRQEDDKVAVAIKDNGCGIKPEQVELIFQPFYTTKPEVQGTGLGLSVSYGIVKKHGGEIIVQSVPGEGSTFTVTLPIIGCDDALDVHQS